MPGIKSLQEAQYYAHPQNRFWKVMSVLCSTDMVSMNYQDRIQTLLNNNFALWDVIKSCSREGSLDSAIENEKPNNIKSILKKYPNIKTIYLNGNKAYSAFKKISPNIYISAKDAVYKPCQCAFPDGSSFKRMAIVNIC